MSTISAPEAPLPDAPYRGAAPFRYSDRAIFTARERETRELLRAVIIHRGVLLYGDSGAGKSSLVNAGLVPAAVLEGFTPERIRLQPNPGAELVVERLQVAEKGAFLPSFLVPEASAQARAVLSLEDLRERLQTVPEEKYPLLIFDQFEELVTLFETGTTPQRAAGRKVQTAVIDSLVRLLRDESLAVKVLLVFREDYLARLSKLLGRAPELQRQAMRLTAPPVEELLTIIRGPFRVERLRQHFTRLGPEITEDVARTLEAQLALGTVDGTVNLTELQIACLELWKSRQPAALLSKLRVQDLLERYLDGALHQVKDRDAAIAILDALVTEKDTRNVLSHETLLSEVRKGGVEAERTARALKELVDKTGLVTREAHRDTYQYEIISEFLLPWISGRRAERRAHLERRLERQFAVQRRRLRGGLSLALLVVLGVLLASALLLRQMTLGNQAALSREVQALRHDSASATQLIGLITRTPAKSTPRFAMFGSTILDVAIGLSVVFLLLSFVCAVVQELMSAAQGRRSHYLKRGVLSLFGGDVRLVEAFYEHPLMRALTLGASRPSYIPSRVFGLVLLDLVAPAAGVAGLGGVAAIRGRVVEFPNTALRTALLPLIDAAHGDLDRLQVNITNWFDDAMESVAGIYKRRTQWDLLALAVVLVVALNVDTLVIADTLWRDSAVRATIVAQAQAAPDTLVQRQVAQGLSELRFPVGWQRFDWYAFTHAWPTHVLGWLITALVISFVASLWFDFLNKFMVVRTTIKPYWRPAEESASEWRAAGPPVLETWAPGPVPVAMPPLIGNPASSDPTGGAPSAAGSA